MTTKNELSIVGHKVMSAIDLAINQNYDKFNTRLGASVIGHECHRYLWYCFRWAFVEQFSNESEKARNLRLLDRGNREEVRFIEWLNAIGCQVWAFDETQPHDEKGNFPQYSFSAINGHFGGSIDAVIKLPKCFGIDAPMLASFKTNGTGKGFTAISEKGVEVAKPMHFAQECTYSEGGFGLDYCMYMYINKNDDSMHVEIVKLSKKLGRTMLIKAESIINSQTAPQKISENSKYVGCQTCKAKHICHDKAIPEKNCRSCTESKPVENCEWFCQKHNSVIPKDFILNGCESWLPITQNSEWK